MKLLLKILGALLLAVVVFALVNMKTIKRLNQVIHLFDEDVIVDNFQNMDEKVPVARMESSSSPVNLPKKIGYQLKDEFISAGEIVQVDEFWDYTQSEGMMIIHKDTIVFERYDRGLTSSTTHISWSMAKSVVATLMGIAVDDGLIDIQKTVTDYLSGFVGTAYDGVRIKDVLQMSTGVKFDEDYGDFNSDINRFGRSFALGNSFEKFSKSLECEREPGTYNHYVSINTQVLGFIIKEVTGKTLSDYYQEKMREPMGMEDKCEWIIDKSGMEMALGGLNMSMRDYAKVGQLYLHKGIFNGKRIVSENWIKASVTPDAPHLMPGNNSSSNSTFGYGYQWWIPVEPNGDFFAAGIYNQYIYVHPENELVIVKLTANHHFKEVDDDSKNVHVNWFQEIAKDFVPAPIEALTEE